MVALPSSPGVSPSGRLAGSRAASATLPIVDGALGALHDKAAIGERHLIDRRLQQMRCDQPAFLDQLFDRHHQRGAAHMHRARAAMAVAAGQQIRVALVEAECGNRQSQHVGRDLRIGGFMSLAVGLRTDRQRHRAVSLERRPRESRPARRARFRGSRQCPMPRSKPALLDCLRRLRKPSRSASAIASSRLASKRPPSIFMPIAVRCGNCADRCCGGAT